MWAGVGCAYAGGAEANFPQASVLEQRVRTQGKEGVCLVPTGSPVSSSGPGSQKAPTL